MEPHDPRRGSSDLDTPAARLAPAARAAQDLCDALWSSLHDELAASARPERIAQLSQRLADVSATIALLAVAADPDLSAAPGVTAAPLRPPEPAPDTGIAIRDARSEEHPAASWSDVPSAPATTPSAWVSAIERRLVRHREDRLSFAVLLIEVLDIERLAYAESAQELSHLTGLLERSLGEELRPADLLTRESLGRYWLVTPDTDRGGARVLAERLARTVRAAAVHRGVGLEVAIGFAVCPEDGLDASALTSHADVGVYAARAAGSSVAPDADA